LEAGERTTIAWEWGLVDGQQSFESHILGRKQDHLGTRGRLIFWAGTFAVLISDQTTIV